MVRLRTSSRSSTRWSAPASTPRLPRSPRARSSVAGKGEAHRRPPVAGAWSPGYGCRVRVSAKVDYALRAMLELASAGGLVKGEQLSNAQTIPRKFLESILVELRHAELVSSQRGVEGGYALARPAEEISVADVIRAVEGPIATVRGARPEDVEYVGAAAGLQPLWLDLRSAMRDVLEQTTLADIVARSSAPRGTAPSRSGPPGAGGPVT